MKKNGENYRRQYRETHFFSMPQHHAQADKKGKKPLCPRRGAALAACPPAPCGPVRRARAKRASDARGTEATPRLRGRDGETRTSPKDLKTKDKRKNEGSDHNTAHMVFKPPRNHAQAIFLGDGGRFRKPPRAQKEREPHRMQRGLCAGAWLRSV